MGPGPAKLSAMASKFLRNVGKINGYYRLICEVSNVQKLEQHLLRCGARSVVGFSKNSLERPEAFVRRTDYFQASLFHTSPATFSEVKTIKCPPFAESITEGDVRWEVEVGDTVAEDQVVAEVETDKTTVPVPSPTAGVILELLIPDGERVEAGSDLFKLQVGAGGAPAAPKAAAPEAPAAPAAPAAAPAAPAPAAKAEIPTTPPPVP